MAHESFEDEEVARLLNEKFVSIKVDREERPDVDAVYMSVCQMLTGSGGWPMTVFLTPDQKPFYAGTYFPKRSRLNMPGLMDISKKLSDVWINNKNSILQVADDLTERVHGAQKYSEEGIVLDLGEDRDPKETIEETINVLYQLYDEENGGFGNAPKFPTPHNILLLLRYYQETSENKALQIAEKTLQQMYRGGLFDHIGYGFARYSTDEKWLAPHFEKMLYDNALLIMAYLEAYDITKNELYKSVAEKTISYINREMTSPEGAFYCAQDADSEGEEGKFYTFTPDEIINILGEEDGPYFNKYFDITNVGNFENKNIPNLLKNSTFAETNTLIEEMLSRVYNYRLGRMTLHKDDKILTSWNALMIAALAKAYKILGDEGYLEIAHKALTFIEKNMKDKNERLLVSYRDGKKGAFAFLDDYAFLTFALLELYEATGKAEYKQKAESMQRDTTKLFWDSVNGGFYMYGTDAEKLIARPKELYDSAMPSGNSVAAWNMIKLAYMSPMEVELQENALKQLQVFNHSIDQYPAGFTFFMLAKMLVAYDDQNQEVQYACGPNGCTVSIH